MPRSSRLPGRLLRRSAVAVVALAAGPVVLAASPASAAPATPATTPTAPPPVTVLTGSASKADGDIFISPFGDQTTYANGPEILNSRGQVVWFKAVPPGEEAADFRAQTYDGKPVLTWWQGSGLGGLSTGTDYIYNDHYQQIATVQAGNGYSADGHEFLITPWNTALILSYTTATANLTSIGGPANQTVIDGIVQEIDVKNGKVLFQWDSADHVAYSQSEQPLPSTASTPWDWFHVNAVHVARDGSLLIDARDTWTTYDVSLRTGKISWQLGGKDSTFTVKAAFRRLAELSPAVGGPG
jgi:Arylsulfotransferase (ASST)